MSGDWSEGRTYGRGYDLHPDDRGVCADCGETYNRRGARLGTPRCSRCDRRRDRGRR